MVLREAVGFWRKGGEGGTARRLFWGGVWQLPVLLVLAMGHKRGLWDGVWGRVFGGGDEGEEEDEGREREDQRVVGRLQAGRL